MSDRYTNSMAAGARALGMLRALLDHGYVPKHHAGRVRNILAQGDDWDGAASEWDHDRDPAVETKAA